MPSVSSASNRLAASLPAGQRKLGTAAAHLTPAQLRALRDHDNQAFQQYLHAFSHSLHIVFASAVPFAAAAFVLSLLLREVPLRRTTGRGAGMDAADSQSMPESAETAVTP